MHTIKFGAVEQTKQIFWLGKTITWQQIVFKNCARWSLYGRDNVVNGCYNGMQSQRENWNGSFHTSVSSLTMGDLCCSRQGHSLGTVCVVWYISSYFGQQAILFTLAVWYLHCHTLFLILFSRLGKYYNVSNWKKTVANMKRKMLKIWYIKYCFLRNANFTDNCMVRAKSFHPAIQTTVNTCNFKCILWHWLCSVSFTLNILNKLLYIHCPSSYDVC